MPKKKLPPHYKRKKPVVATVAELPGTEELVSAIPAWKFDPIAATEIIGLLLLPLLAFFVMRFVPINQNGFLDPYVYTGYIHDFKELLARYGLTYYSVRFGMIAPARWFTELFGPEAGYLTFRYVLASIAGMPLYYMVKRRFSRPVAVLTVVALLTSPYFARAVLWDYPDAAGVPYLVAAISLFLLDDRPSFWRDAAAGAFTAMAVNSNFFEVALFGIFGGLWLCCFLAFRRPLGDLARRVGSVAVGGLIVFVLGCVYYWHALGRPTNIFYPTLGMALSLARGGAQQWHTADPDWITMQIHVLIPVVLGICCIAVIRWRRFTFIGLLVLGFGLASTGFYYIEQFLLNSDILQLFYYFSYLIPAVFLMLAFLWQTLWERTTRREPVFLGLGLAALLAQWMLMTWGDLFLPFLSMSTSLALAGAVTAVMFLATRDWWPAAVRNVMALLALLLVSGCFTAEQADYRDLLRSSRSSDKREMDVYRVALQFLRAVPRVSEYPGAIVFWYKNRPGNSIRSVQSTHLWGYSKLNRNPPEDPGLPYLDKQHLQSLRRPEVRYLALLGESEDEISQGLAALRRDSVEFSPADHRVLASGDYRVYFQLVELKHR